jgi:hypothetical protein
MLKYPNPNRPFDIYPNVSRMYAMAALLEQDRKIVSTFLQKLMNAQLKYMVTGQELLAAVMVCKHVAQIIRGCDIRIHTDHQNLTHNDTHHVNLRELHTRFFLDAEFAPTFVHIKGMDNTAADGLSRLPMADDAPTEIANNIFAILPNNLDREENTDFHLDMKRIVIAQKSNNALQQHIMSGKYSENIATININGSGMTTFNGKVWVPKELQQRIVERYLSNLQHVGINRTINSIGQTCEWKKALPDG